jgi:hypothetical protein
MLIVFLEQRYCVHPRHHRRPSRSDYSRAWGQSHVPRNFQIMTTMVTWLLPLLRLFRVTSRIITVEEAAKPVIEVAVSDRFAGKEGYSEGEQKMESSPDSMDEDMQNALWRKSVEWCGLRKEDTMIELERGPTTRTTIGAIRDGRSVVLI